VTLSRDGRWSPARVSEAPRTASCNIHQAASLISCRSALAAGRWFFVHGGAGAVISSGAMRRASFDDVEGFLHTIETVSGGG